MRQLVRVNVADLGKNVLVHRHGRVDDEGASGADALRDINADIFETGVKADDAVRAIDIALHLNGLIRDAAVGVDRRALAFLPIRGDCLSKLTFNNGGIGQDLGRSDCALTAAGIESEFPHNRSSSFNRGCLLSYSEYLAR